MFYIHVFSKLILIMFHFTVTNLQVHTRVIVMTRGFSITQVVIARTWDDGITRVKWDGGIN